MSGKKRTGPPIEGSRKARQHAAGILSVLAGEATTAEASAMMQISLPRYYQLETRALAGMVTSLEPKPRGRAKTPESEIASLTKENGRLRRELTRSQALVRAAHRALGLKSPGKGNGAKTKKKPSRKPNRAKRAIARLTKPGEDGEAPEKGTA